MALKDDARLVYLYLDQKDVWHIVRVRPRHITEPSHYYDNVPTRETLHMANKMIVIDPRYDVTWVLKDRWSTQRVPYRLDA